MSTFGLYVLVMLGNSRCLFFGFTLASILCAFVIGAYLLVKIDSRELDEVNFKFIKKLFKFLGSLFIIGVLGLTFVPSTKQAAFIYLTPKMVNAVAENKELMKIPNNAIKLLNVKMEEYVQESLVGVRNKK